MHKWQFIILFFSLAMGLQAARTDTVYLYNGDRITGEIKFMHDNKLSYKTDRAGTVSIEWPSVERIYSTNFFDIVLSSGQRFFGSLSYSDTAREVVIILGLDSVTRSMDDIVAIDRVKTTFWEQLSGSLFLNANYTNANQNLQINTGFDITHRNRKFVNTVKANTLVTSTQTTEETERTDASYSFQRLYGYRWFVASALSYQRNTELNIGSRYQLFGGAGYYLLRKPSQDLYLVSGLAGNSERSNIEPITQTENVEFVASFTFHQFKFRNPQFDIFANVQTYSSFTVPGRFRVDAEIKIMWEVFNDFKWNITFYENFDRKPPGGDEPTNDWNISTGITYSL
jgi:hypothetical protein